MCLPIQIKNSGKQIEDFRHQLDNTVGEIILILIRIEDTKGTGLEVETDVTRGQDQDPLQDQSILTTDTQGQSQKIDITSQDTIDQSTLGQDLDPEVILDLGQGQKIGNTEAI